MKNEQKTNQNPISEIKGSVYKLGAFSVIIEDDLAVRVDTVSGVFSCRYAPGTLTWGMLVGLLYDGKTNIVENFIKGIVYPTAMRLHDIDAEYTDDIYNAHNRLSERNAASGLSEEVEKVFDIDV